MNDDGFQKIEDRMLEPGVDRVTPPSPSEEQKKLNLMYVKMLSGEELLAIIAIDESNEKRVYLIEPLSINVISHPMSQDKNFVILDDWINSEYIEDTGAFPVDTMHIVTFCVASQQMLAAYASYMAKKRGEEPDEKDKAIEEEEELIKGLAKEMKKITEDESKINNNVVVIENETTANSNNTYTMSPGYIAHYHLDNLRKKTVH